MYIQQYVIYSLAALLITSLIYISYMKIGNRIYYDDQTNYTYPFIKNILYYKLFHSDHLDRDTKSCIRDLYLLLQINVEHFDSIRMKFIEIY